MTDKDSILTHETRTNWAGSFVSGGNFAVSAQCLPLYTYLFAVYDSGNQQTWGHARGLVGPETNGALPPLGWAWLRPGAVKLRGWHERL